MYDKLKSIAETNNWVFTYARKDYSNLYDEDIDVNIPHLFVDPIELDEIFDEYNNVESTNYNGSFMLLLSSDIDEEDYNSRYQKYIKPIINTSLQSIKDELQCEEITIQSWRVVEVIDVFDFNLDGVLVTFSINEQ